MITTKVYEDQNGDLVAVVLEDGQYVNYIPCPEIVAMDGDGFLQEARMGFPEALLYEFDGMIGLTLEEAAKREEEESTLIAEAGEQIKLYPQRMSPENQEFFQIELGDDVWRELLERVSGNAGVDVVL